MSQKKPLVLDYTASVEQLQAGDRLTDAAVDLGDRTEFDSLKNSFWTLIQFFNANGINLPLSLIAELQNNPPKEN